jgi:hypothetical protein
VAAPGDKFRHSRYNRRHCPDQVFAMAQLVFTQQLARFTSVPALDSGAAVLRAALDDAFAINPLLRGYVLDDQGHLRENVVIFIDGQRMRERILLDDPLRPDSKVYVLQALSGG